MRNGRSIKCNKGGKEEAAPTTEREFDVDDIHGKKGGRERERERTFHNIRSRINFKSLIVWTTGSSGNLISREGGRKRDGGGTSEKGRLAQVGCGGLKLLTRHEVKIFLFDVHWDTSSFPMMRR